MYSSGHSIFNRIHKCWKTAGKGNQGGFHSSVFPRLLFMLAAFLENAPAVERLDGQELQNTLPSACQATWPFPYILIFLTHTYVFPNASVFIDSPIPPSFPQASPICFLSSFSICFVTASKTKQKGRGKKTEYKIEIQPCSW